MDEIRNFFIDKKNLVTITTLLLLLIVLPVGIALIRSQQIYNSKASGERIQIGTGRCVTEKDGKKVLTCTEVPLNLIAPFNPASTPTPSASAGATLNKENLMSKISNAVVKEAKSYGKNICSGDTTPGAGGLIDFALNGCGEILNYDQLYHSCVPSATVQYKPPVWNATKHEWETIRQDGKVISQAEMIQKSQQDGRFPIALSSTDNPPWINCEVYFEYSGRTDCDVTPQKNANNQPMGREGTELLPGQVFTMDVAKAGNNIDPDCKQQVQVQLGGPATPAPTPTPTPRPSATPSPSPTPSTAPTSPPQCTAGTFASAQMEDPNGCGSIISQPSTGSTTGFITYKAPNVTSDLSCKLKVNTGNNGDCKLNAGTLGTATNPLKPNETMNINYTNACVDSTAGCELPIIISNAGTIPTDKAAYKLAESEAALASASERGFQTQQFSAIYNLSNSTPGMKTIWVEFTDKQTGQKTKDFISIELVETNPLIKAVSCRADISNNSIAFDVNGLRFGTEKAKITANGTELTVTSWNQTDIKAALKNPQSNDGKAEYKVKVVRADNSASDEIPCTIGFRQVNLGTQLICRGEGKMDLSNVSVTIVDEAGNKTEEQASILADGTLSNLKTRLEIGKNYTISIQAPRILRRSITFKAQEGTNVITKDDGTKLQLPVGDIAPASKGDGIINSIDQSELMRQWRIVDATAEASLSGDFNDDKRINAFDWSCMRQGFGSSSDGPAKGPGEGTISVTFTDSSNSSNNDHLTVTFSDPTPNPNLQNQATPTKNEPKIFIQGN